MSIQDWTFLIACFGLGLLAEISFFHGEIGISYPIFIIGFYLVFFIRFRLSFQHRRIGVLLMAVIWVLSGSYAIYDNELFYLLNIVVIPLLVFFHIVLITSPKTMKWASIPFVFSLKTKFLSGFQYLVSFGRYLFKCVFRNTNEETRQLIKRILVGLMIGFPLLFIITGLLMSADKIFEDIVLQLPNFLLRFDAWESVFRAGLVVLLTLLFFGVFQVLKPHSKEEHSLAVGDKKFRVDSITALTILVMLNAVYLLFAFIQFNYFFGQGLQDGFTYASYARRGFFELLFVTCINWVILIACLKLVHNSGKTMKVILKAMYSIIILVSGVMLASAYQRLSMYEAAYGFTMDRILAHAFMIFLMIIFAYTFIRVWLEKLTLLHFYFISSLLFYTVLNAIDIEQIIVNNNIERYKDTGKIDIHYLNTLSYTGVEGLMELYVLDPEYPELQTILMDRKQQFEHNKESSWQSFNFTKQHVTEKLNEMNFINE
ncbi:DUF4173 domain-containing protein [Oceanobacillus halophilus]|uniref:DUF4173 domain-containing protein n=2 Tax=Oceanobacillus halophilus TaxID=930130 RepID=A0A494ZSI6_9BACI|nr:DUF4173 domain-containing protein [Oceanobacillus halophilus]